MRGKLIISAVVVALIGVASPALADFFYPGRVIIGYVPPPGGITIPPPTTTTNAMVGPGCVLEQALECECFPGATVLEACQQSGVDSCLKPDMPYLEIVQKEPVVFDIGKHTLGTVICSGKSDGTAHIVLPKPQG